MIERAGFRVARLFGFFQSQTQAEQNENSACRPVQPALESRTCKCLAHFCKQIGKEKILGCAEKSGNQSEFKKLPGQRPVCGYKLRQKHHKIEDRFGIQHIRQKTGP